MAKIMSTHCSPSLPQRITTSDKFTELAVWPTMPVLMLT